MHSFKVHSDKKGNIKVDGIKRLGYKYLMTNNDEVLPGKKLLAFGASIYYGSIKTGVLYGFIDNKAQEIHMGGTQSNLILKMIKEESFPAIINFESRRSGRLYFYVTEA